MKKLINKILLLSVIIGLSGCGITWVNLDNTKVSESIINKAKIKCQYEKERTKANKYLAFTNSYNPKSVNENFKKLYDKTWNNVKKCMRKEGLKINDTNN